MKLKNNKGMMNTYCKYNVLYSGYSKMNINELEKEKLCLEYQNNLEKLNHDDIDSMLNLIITLLLSITTGAFGYSLNNIGDVLKSSIGIIISITIIFILLVYAISKSIRIKNKRKRKKDVYDYKFKIKIIDKILEEKKG